MHRCDGSDGYPAASGQPAVDGTVLFTHVDGVTGQPIEAAADRFNLAVDACVSTTWLFAL
jgi:hypothetical protein